MKRSFTGGFLAVALLLAPTLPAVADCKCIANGRSFEQGETTCIRLSSGSYTARCEKVLNNSSWKRVSDDCSDMSRLDRPAAESPPPKTRTGT